MEYSYFQCGEIDLAAYGTSFSKDEFSDIPDFDDTDELIFETLQVATKIQVASSPLQRRKQSYSISSEDEEDEYSCVRKFSAKWTRSDRKRYWKEPEVKKVLEDVRTRVITAVRASKIFGATYRMTGIKCKQYREEIPDSQQNASSGEKTSSQLKYLQSHKPTHSPSSMRKLIRCCGPKQMQTNADLIKDNNDGNTKDSIALSFS